MLTWFFLKSYFITAQSAGFGAVRAQMGHFAEALPKGETGGCLGVAILYN